MSSKVDPEKAKILTRLSICGIIFEIMEKTVNLRIKQIRENLELSQRAFSRLLSSSNSYIAGIETGARAVNDRLIKLISTQFGVNEEWLRSGKGGMFTVPSADKKSTRLLSLFNSLSQRDQEVILGLIELLQKIPRQ